MDQRKSRLSSILSGLVMILVYQFILVQYLNLNNDIVFYIKVNP